MEWYDPRDWDIVDTAREIARDPWAAASDGAKGAANFVVGFTNAALGTDFEGFCGPGQSWSRNIGSATFFVEAALSLRYRGELADRLFARKTGLLNSNDILRTGWGWKGSATAGREVFRIGIGKSRWHIDIWESGLHYVW